MSFFPKDAEQIFSYLTSQGYSPIAASGILGNIGVEGPSGPESRGTGGGGLIGWTPESAAYPIQPIITGNEQRDLHAQLVDLIAWGKRNNAAPGLMNSATTPSTAAALWETHAERAGIVVMAERQAIAEAVYKASKSGKWPQGTAAAASSSSGSGGIFGNLGNDLINNFLGQFGIKSLGDFVQRAFLILTGLILVLIGIIRISGTDFNAPTPSLGGSGGGSKASGERQGQDYSDKPYKSEAGKAQYEKAQDRNTEKEYNKKMSESGSGPVDAEDRGSGSQSIKSFGRSGPLTAAERAEVPF